MSMSTPAARARAAASVQIRRDAMIDELCDRIVVADHNSIETRLFSQPVAQDRFVGGHRHASDVVERRHDRCSPGGDGGGEWRQIDFAQRSLGKVRGGIFTASRHRPVSAKMLGRRGHALGVREIRALKTARFCNCELRADPSVFAGTLDDTSPTRVARHVEHRREGQADAIPCGLLGSAARGFFPQDRVEQTGLRQRHWKNRPVAVDDIEAEQQRDSEPRFLDREALHGVYRFASPEVQKAAYTPGANICLDATNFARPGDGARRCDHIELSDLFLDGHRREQNVDAFHAFTCREHQRMVSAADFS